MEVLGIDMARGAYKVAVKDDGEWVSGFIPEAVMAWNRPPHQMAYEWIADHERGIRRALLDLAGGRVPPAPYDTMTLSGDT